MGLNFGTRWTYAYNPIYTGPVSGIIWASGKSSGRCFQPGKRKARDGDFTLSWNPQEQPTSPGASTTFPYSIFTTTPFLMQAMGSMHALQAVGTALTTWVLTTFVRSFSLLPIRSSTRMHFFEIRLAASSLSVCYLKTLTLFRPPGLIALGYPSISGSTWRLRALKPGRAMPSTTSLPAEKTP